MGRPATGQTPVHSIRIPPHVWDEMLARVGDGNMSVHIVTLMERDNAAAARRPAGPAQPPAVPPSTPAPADGTQAYTRALATLDDAAYTQLKREAISRAGSTNPDLIARLMYEAAKTRGLIRAAPTGR